MQRKIRHLVHLAAATVLVAAAIPAEAQIGGLPLPPITVPTLPGVVGLRYGCPWIPTNDATTNNTGYPDEQATYTAATIPVNVPAGDRIVIRGRFPMSRYFSFQAYDGFRPGNVIDSLPDARILPTQGGTLNPNPAVLPDNNNYTNRYEVTVLFQDAPSAPALRQQNVLYAGSSSSRGALTKQIVYRIYYPNNGRDDNLAGVPLPDLIYQGATGEIDLNKNSPDQRSCNFMAAVEQNNRFFPAAGVGQGQSSLAFRPVTATGTAVFYPNADATYLRAQPGKQFGDLVVVRALAQKTPALPPAVVPDPDVRYWSLCQNQLINTAVVECIADREMTLQSDGYFTAVVSLPEMRPALAYSQFGYNWLPFGPATNALLALRQILARPDFDGNYDRVLAKPNAPLSDTIGIWAPQITYCDSATFAANAGAGGAAVFSACKTAADAKSLLGGTGSLVP